MNQNHDDESDSETEPADGEAIPASVKPAYGYRDKLREIAKLVAEGGRPTETVRTFISWFFGSQRRGRWVVSHIRNQLDEFGLQTIPDFDSTYLDGDISFVQKAPVVPAAAESAPTPASVGIEQQADLVISAAPEVSAFEDPTYQYLG